MASWEKKRKYASFSLMVLFCHCFSGFPGGSDGKESAWQCKRPWFYPWEDPLEKGVATHSSILAWKIPWTQEPGGLQSMGSQRVRHSWAIEHTYVSPYLEILALFLWKLKRNGNRILFFFRITSYPYYALVAMKCWFIAVCYYSASW